MKLATADRTSADTFAAAADLSELPQLLKPAADLCSGVHGQRSILFLVDQLSELGGGERALFDLARALKREGHRIFVVTFKGDPDPAAFALFDSITFMPLTSCFSPGGLRTAFQLRRFIRREHIGIVQTYFESSDIFGALVARLSGVSCVLSSRRDMGILRSRKHRVAYRLMRRAYSAVLAVSDQVRQHHIYTDRLREQRVHTIYNGVSLDRFRRAADRGALRQLFHLPADAPLVATITNINPWKGVDVFLQAAARVHLACPKACFVIAGAWTDRALAESLQEQARLLGIERCTFFLGHVADAPGLLLTSDIFALLSRSEGLPNVVLEAMAASLPVVASAVGGSPEVVRDQVTGFLVENEDANAAAAHILRLLSDSSLRERMGTAGRRRVEAEFSLDHMVRKHLELYNRLLPTGH